MAYCTLCRKSFKTDEALRQHTENSPAHTLVHCATCNKNFPHEEALAQHTRDSPAHKDVYKCEPCQRSFSSQDSLDQHTQTSPAHAISHTCEPCARTFASEEALAQHLQTASKHTTSHLCTLCDRAFPSPTALQQHARDSPAHRPAPHPCPHCTRTFGSATALAQHVRDTPPHSSAAPPPPPRATPLDAFFLGYAATAGFAHDRAAAPAASYGRLRRHMGWERGGEDDAAAWAAYGAALRRELEVWFGAEDDLAGWHALCRAVGVAPLPETAAGCERALRGRHVNLVDLLQWAREGGAGEGEGRVGAVRVFASVGKLRSYCYEEDKIFPLDEVSKAGKAGDGNVVIRHLLRRFSPAVKARTDSVVGFLKA
ncbi:hypothetical protein GTA08_BOTSDO07890 [Neofusicoccum parvum]|nr:hypothetical protein GTA08_BOTSDO07890 [Neofusicoccum parvum]